MVVGGGFAGLETAFNLRRQLDDRAGLTMTADREHFLFKPNTIHYLPIQFRAGRPFHAGRPWRAMQLALNGMSRTLATGPPA